jgi:hypothetical protein
MPVGMAWPVSGHLIITIPILTSSSLASAHGKASHGKASPPRLDRAPSGEDARPADPRGQ